MRTLGGALGGVFNSSRVVLMCCKQRARKKFAVLLLVEPRALDVEQLEARHEPRERERVDRELRDRLVGARIRLVIEDVHGAVAHLQKVDVAGDRSLGRTHPRRELDAVLLLERGDVGLCQPDRDLDRDRHAVVGEHELLQRLVTQLVVADGRNDEAGDARRHVLFAVDDDARDIGELRMRL